MKLHQKYKQFIDNILTVILCLLAIFQAPVFYYYTSGMMSLFVIMPYLSFALFLTAWLLMSGKGEKTRFQRVGVVFSISIGTLSLFFGASLVEKFDWKYYKDERQMIVDRAIKGEFTEWKVKMDYFLPISNGGNEVFVEKREEGIKVTFFIDRGFIDHYSAFVYTNIDEDIQRYEKRINSEHWKKTNKKLDLNWYRISE